MILDGGNCSIGVESTIIHVKVDEITLLRPGGLDIEEIENIVGAVTTPKVRTDRPLAPGQLEFHYAPQIPLKFFNDVNITDYKDKKVGALFFKKNFTQIEFSDEKILSSKGDLREAAANLFSHLHDFENKSLDIILVESIDETGLGKAIMDRLRKAANKFM
ncbi:L-threonylcarbamoyladenylate synthase [Bacteroidota bacterium]